MYLLERASNNVSGAKEQLQFNSFTNTEEAAILHVQLALHFIDRAGVMRYQGIHVPIQDEAEFLDVNNLPPDMLELDPEWQAKNPDFDLKNPLTWKGTNWRQVPKRVKAEHIGKKAHYSKVIGLLANSSDPAKVFLSYLNEHYPKLLSKWIPHDGGEWVLVEIDTSVNQDFTTFKAARRRYVIALYEAYLQENYSVSRRTHLTAMAVAAQRQLGRLGKFDSGLIQSCLEHALDGLSDIATATLYMKSLPTFVDEFIACGQFPITKEAMEIDGMKVRSLVSTIIENELLTYIVNEFYKVMDTSISLVDQATDHIGVNAVINTISVPEIV